MLLPHYHKTRIAPTPSGFLHLGNVLSFAVTAALAKITGAKILLRIDDLDQARVNPEYIQDIFEILDFLQIPYDEGPCDADNFEAAYSQTLRMDRYNLALQKLSDEGLLFACACSRQKISNGIACGCYEKKLPLTTENVSWRLFTGDNCKANIKGINGEIKEAVLPTYMKNFVVKKKDHYPAYQLTSVIDDIFYGVDLIVRGQDLCPSTIAQQILAHKLGYGNIFGEIAFYHHALIMETFGKKLSKSAGATSIKYLRASGKTSADIFSLIGSMAGVKQRIEKWEQLAEVLINQ